MPYCSAGTNSSCLWQLEDDVFNCYNLQWHRSLAFRDQAVNVWMPSVCARVCMYVYLNACKSVFATRDDSAAISVIARSVWGEGYSGVSFVATAWGPESTYYCTSVLLLPCTSQKVTSISYYIVFSLSDNEWKLKIVEIKLRIAEKPCLHTKCLIWWNKEVYLPESLFFFTTQLSPP